MLQGLLDHHRELAVALGSLADVARVDAELRERPGALRMLAQQLVAVEVEIADERDHTAHRVEPFPDGRHGGGGVRRIDGDPDELGTGRGELAGLADGGGDVGGVGVGHRLDDDRRAAADPDAADIDLPRAMPQDRLAHRDPSLAAVIAT